MAKLIQSIGRFRQRSTHLPTLRPGMFSLLESTNFFSKGPDGKYFGGGGLYRLSQLLTSSGPIKQPLTARKQVNVAVFQENFICGPLSLNLTFPSFLGVRKYSSSLDFFPTVQTHRDQLAWGQCKNRQWAGFDPCNLLSSVLGRPRL